MKKRKIKRKIEIFDERKEINKSNGEENREKKEINWEMNPN